ncbi:hypothetical protein BOX15_Mlig021533g1 [Macrostomum lignano]|uniref:Tetratricopeptide repeat protein 7 N-terminal domain-containing protein n=2 Tax=Macrostomum lignano TaxID=282301 RepID=A0A267FIY8_9PLAT|nr:hypothetical protein BOX15_Mlig021533g1 [Macrostomum lignano]
MASSAVVTKTAKSPRIKRNKQETEFEKYRLEEKWSTILDVLKTAKVPKSDFIRLCEVEAQLENFLLNDYAGADSVVPTAYQETLRSIFNSGSDDLVVHIDSGLLLAKALYYSNLYQEALSVLDDLALDSQSGWSAASRTSRLLSEGYAVRGICLEKVSQSQSHVVRIGRHEEVIECYERAGDLYIQHLQESQAQVLDKRTVTVSEEVGHALQQSPILRMSHGDLTGAIHRLRQVLRCHETKCSRSIRQTLSRQLAEILLRGVSPETYRKPELSRARTIGVYQHSGDDLLVPDSPLQEAILLLMISELIAFQQAVLSRDQDTRLERKIAFENTVAVYDLLCVALSRVGAYAQLTEILEHAMKFSFGESHIWLQFGLALISAGNLSRGLAVFQECYRLETMDGHYCLLAAKAAFELQRLGEGLRWVERAGSVHRAALFRGVGCLLKAADSRSLEERRGHLDEGEKALRLACAEDPADYLAFYHLALCLAEQRNLQEARATVLQALELNPDHTDSAHLLALVYTGLRQWDVAQKVLSAASRAHPYHSSILITRASLAAFLHGLRRAVNVYRALIQSWTDRFGDSGRQEGSVLDRWLGRLDSELMERDQSVKRESAAASRIEHAFTELVTGTSDCSLSASGGQASGQSEAQRLQVRILLELAELYVDHGMLQEAGDAVRECEQLVRLSHHVLYLRGRILEACDQPARAREAYQDAVSINPGHVRSLQRLGLLLIRQGNLQLAEKILTDAVNYQPTSSRSWTLLGQALSLTGQEAEAAQCLLTAAELEQTEPFVPFYFLPKGVP